MESLFKYRILFLKNTKIFPFILTWTAFFEDLELHIWVTWGYRPERIFFSMKQTSHLRWEPQRETIEQKGIFVEGKTVESQRILRKMEFVIYKIMYFFCFLQISWEAACSFSYFSVYNTVFLFYLDDYYTR